MSALCWLYASVQAAAWIVAPTAVTVGDTVEITRRVAAESGVIPQAAALGADAVVQPLNAPVIAYTEGTVVVRYQVALFEPGFHGLAMPDIELVYPDGGSVTVPGDTAWITVQSVLPVGDSTPPPRPSLGPIARARTEMGFVVLPVLAVVGITVLWGISRRQRRERPSWRSGPGKRVEAPVVQWARAGELRAVVSAVTDRLRESIERALPVAGRQLSTDECLDIVAQRQPDWPMRELEAVLRALDQARFSPAVPSDIVQLAQRAGRLSSSMVRSTAEELEN
jgi:hypothetical protein